MLCAYLIKLPVVLNLFSQRLFPSNRHSVTQHIKNYICISGFFYCIYVEHTRVCAHAYEHVLSQWSLVMTDMYSTIMKQLQFSKKQGWIYIFIDQLKKLHSV